MTAPTNHPAQALNNLYNMDGHIGMALNPTASEDTADMALAQALTCGVSALVHALLAIAEAIPYSTGRT